MPEITYAEQRRLDALVARAVGFVPKLAKGIAGCWYLEQPDGKPTPTDAMSGWSRTANDSYQESPDFTRDLNAWLAWGLPWLGVTLRVRDRGDRWRIQMSPWEDIVVVDAEHISGGMVHEEGPLSELPLLLCRLVEKIVEGASNA
jgi:hypothetical protein